jgi:hypothetical protein
MRPMDATMIDEHLENIDRRLTTLEQILPTLATKAELQTLATKDEIKTLATRDEIKTLATKDELKTLATKDDIHELRRHMEVLIEDQRSDTRLLAEHLAIVISRLPDR